MSLKNSYFLKNTDITRTLLFCLLVFFSLLNINLVRVFKDTVCILGIGVQNISFVKGILEFPFSIFIVYLYNILYKKLGRLNSFLSIVAIFISFFCFFGIFIYLKQASYESSESIFISKFDYIVHQFPYVLLYLFGEVWPVVLYSFLIWSFVHTRTPYKNAKKDYPIYSIVGQMSIIMAGFLLLNMKDKLNDFLGIENEIVLMCCLIFFTGSILVILYICIFYTFLSVKKQTVENEVLVNKKNQKMNFLTFSVYLKESFDLLKEHKDIRRLLFTVISYAFLVTLIHLIWFHNITLYYKNSASKIIDIQSYLNYYTGCLTIILGIFSRKIFKVFKWKNIFISIPIINFLFATLFLITLLHKNTPFLSLIIGNMYYVVSRSSKYVLFDTAKEIFFSKYNNNFSFLSKSKSLVDVIGFKFGKSFGANFIAISLYFFTQKDSTNIFYIFLIFIVMFMYYIWIKNASKIKR